MTGRTLALSLLLTAAALGGCGKMGDLERPDARGAAAAPSPADATASGQQRDDNGDPNTGSEGPVNRQSAANRDVDPAPPRTLPIDGAPPDPAEMAPQGALPDPYANPQ
jgi:predicted small lipoprotein YifL